MRQPPRYVLAALNAATNNVIRSQRAQEWLERHWPGNPFETIEIAGHFVTMDSRTGIFVLTE